MTHPDTLKIIQKMPINYHAYNLTSGVSKCLQEARADIPLRAQSVSLSERPRSKYERSTRSADHRSRYPDKQFIHQPLPRSQPKKKSSKVLVKQQKRKVIEKLPCAVSVQTLSIPMKYADKHSTSKILYNDRVDRTKSSNPPKQVSDNKRLCATTGCGKETENKLLLQICEAEQVSDFERILNSNAIQSARAHRHVWRGCKSVSSASAISRPRSAYSLKTASQTYYELFQQHELSLKPLVEQYRKAATDDNEDYSTVNLQQEDWFENLQDLSEFYEDDQDLQQEIETITDKIVTEEVKALEIQETASTKNKNFVNLTDLIGLRVDGEGYSPILAQDGHSPDVDKGVENEEEGKEWLGVIMSAKSDDPSNQKQKESVNSLAQNLETVNIDSDAKVPSITFSNCCDGCGKSEQTSVPAVDVYLAVPSIDSADESRPPM